MSTVQDSPQKKQTHSPWSFKIATVAGIPIRIHFTFVLFFVWVAVAGQGLSWPLLILTLFACVILHELGHALTAQHFDVQTRDITLYPIGGVAMLQGRPTPRQELWIALAGPAVNIAIAALLLPVVLVNQPGIKLQTLMGSSFVANVMIANITLALFNLIPAFPMDGGRVLRAALALNMPEEKATQIAASIGQALAIGFGLWGLLNGQVILLLIAFFVFIGAGQEASASMTRSFLAGHLVKDAMMVKYKTIEHGLTMDAAAQMLLAGPQHDFPVVTGDEVVGILTRNDIARGLATVGPTGYVAEIMNREPKTTRADVPLESAMEFFQSNDSAPVLVMGDAGLEGILTSENFSEFIMLEAARTKGRHN
jgi:Zn-dependent protease/CBS domain-containing protein